ncbi:rare lipoprotein A [Burkholderiales bacterium JOSHI_001]|nr:rare lipoprotein A [Burkholderiales bacterium JOSHI_001]
MVPLMRGLSFIRQGLGAISLGLLWGCASAPPGNLSAPPVVDARPQAPPAPGPTGPAAPPQAELPRPAPSTTPAPTERELLQRPDPEPRVEPVRPGGPNKPYEVSGESFQPQLGDMKVQEKGLASWYGRPFHGRKTASGEVYDMYAMTAAHKTLPIPSYVRVRNPSNGREIIVRINDRGPFVAGRIVDLSYAAAVKLGTTRGVAPVELERITHDEILAGRWRREGAPTVVAVAANERDLAAAKPASPAVHPRGSAANRSPRTSAAPATVVPAAPPEAAVTAPVSMPTVDAQALPPSDGPVLVAAVPLPPPPAEAATPSGPATPANTPPSRPQPAFTTAARGFWVQLGAFTHSDGAATFRRRVEQQALWLAPLLAVFNDAGLHRLQAGPYPSRHDAHSAADRLRQALSLSPLVLERK